MYWNQYSESKLVNLEQKILSVLKTTYNTRYINITGDKDTEEKIWTISLNVKSDNTPLVLLHGFAAGIGFWVRNLDSLSKDRPVYALDLLGFGRSSRPEFSNDNFKAEQQMVDSIEAWRKQMKLDKFILLGHSLGAYLATLYTISYPDQVKHLILADPWGFSDRSQSTRNPPLKFRILGFFLYPFTNLNPLATVRGLGPFGPWWIQKMRGDISNKFEDLFEDKSTIPNYIYHCNAQNPTGETAFKSMIYGFGWAKNPMIYRMDNLKKEVPLTILFGSNTWMDKTVGPMIKELRPDAFVDVQMIDNAGHHIYTDQADEFNRIVIQTCHDVDLKNGNIFSGNDNSHIMNESEDENIESRNNNSEMETI
ncbi:hypothetical protein WA026_018328 [Henosepilachna vigintioctopunctata]|uniref:1-acylglycerol-3-phosphate O-acyltransferase ABHD5 n=1 Tax=Henosepilachna vigintioctopunctata TaxID=420089 RepID=A0AAW1VH84_9CUCU